MSQERDTILWEAVEFLLERSAESGDRAGAELLRRLTAPREAARVRRLLERKGSAYWGELAEVYGLAENEAPGEFSLKRAGVFLVSKDQAKPAHPILSQAHAPEGRWRRTEPAERPADGREWAWEPWVDARSIDPSKFFYCIGFFLRRGDVPPEEQLARAEAARKRQLTNEKKRKHTSWW